ncbi:MAG: outer membrane lipoprotein-sorting protein [SAR324 cluster bacterium]|nr:outer membrane lipoprotein-sorting protein [SAR324 cluster bacterium]
MIGIALHSMAWTAPLLSAPEILFKIDQNLTSANLLSVSSFTIHGSRSTRTIKAKSWIQGAHRSFTEYLSPPREKGNKMLKLDDNLWIYYPNADRVIKIAGHMLRQSVMGSDLSYEDMMENNKLHEAYQATIQKTDTFLDRPCWVMSLQAKQPDQAYSTRKVWVDQERFITLKQELFAKSGKLLKRVEMREVFLVKDRWYPKRLLFKDILKKGEGTEVLIHTIEFDVDIPPSRFSKASLRR